MWLYTLLSGALGLVLGLKLPNLHWTSETAAVKQSAAPVLALFANWAVLALLAGLWWLGPGAAGGPGRPGRLLRGAGRLLRRTLAWLRRGGARAWQRL